MRVITDIGVRCLATASFAMAMACSSDTVYSEQTLSSVAVALSEGYGDEKCISGTARVPKPSPHATPEVGRRYPATDKLLYKEAAARRGSTATSAKPIVGASDGAERDFDAKDAALKASLPPDAYPAARAELKRAILGAR